MMTGKTSARPRGRGLFARALPVLISIGFSTVGVAAQSQDRAAAWREDLRALVRQIEERHPNPWHTTPRRDFQDAVATLERDLPRMQDHEAVVGLMSIAALIGDGHTRVAFPEWFGRYAFDLMWLDGVFRVIRVTPELSAALGTRLVRIDDISVTEAYARVSRAAAQGESEGWSRFLGAILLGTAEVLHATGVTASPDSARFTFQTDHGDRFTLWARPFSKTTAPYPQEVLSAGPEQSDRTPVSRREGPRRIGWSLLPGTRTVYFEWDHYLMDQPRSVFADTARAFFAFLDASGADRLIIDLRENQGGDFTKGRNYLLNELQKRRQFLKPGALYVLIGRRTFSAAMVNAIDFKKAAGAELVGEPTGARPNSYSETGFFTLPRSRLPVTVSICRYEFWDDDVPGMPPDRFMPPTWLDYRDGRDSALEFILREPVPGRDILPRTFNVRLTPPCSR